MQALSWTKLSSLRTTQILKIGYVGVVFVPIYAHLIVLLDIDVINAGAHMLGDDIPFKLPPSLFFLFIGSLSLSLGHILNEILCPPLIKEHGRKEEYRLRLCEHISQQSIISERLKELEEHFARDLIKNRVSNVTAEFATKVSSEVVKYLNDKRELSAFKKLEDELNNYESIWKAKNKNNPKFRATICSLYFLSASIVVGLVLYKTIIVFQATFFVS